MNGNGPQIVGIVGGSCAGKTWLADRVSESLGQQAVRISQDNFYLDRSYLPVARRARINFDHPRAIDWKSFERMLRDCAARKKFSVPRYDFETHARTADQSVFDCAPVVIVEGLWLFRRAPIRDLFTLKIFIRAPRDLCVDRRLARDVRERGRTHEQVLAQMERHTLPMFERFVAPQERWADVVLEAPVRVSDIWQIRNRIEENLCAFGI